MGPQPVSNDYKARGVKMVSMSQFEMTAWVKKGTREEVGVITDHTDSKLTEFAKGSVEEYLSIHYVETRCGYACGDHASWEKVGYPLSSPSRARSPTRTPIFTLLLSKLSLVSSSPLIIDLP